MSSFSGTLITGCVRRLVDNVLHAYISSRSLLLLASLIDNPLPLHSHHGWSFISLALSVARLFFLFSFICVCLQVSYLCFLSSIFGTFSVLRTQNPDPCS
ncbi:hypothetical protein BDV10DRAFT_157383 [Aspergillus recurvatus]